MVMVWLYPVLNHCTTDYSSFVLGSTHMSKLFVIDPINIVEHLWNVTLFQRDHTSQCGRRQSSSHLLPENLKSQNSTGICLAIVIFHTKHLKCVWYLESTVLLLPCRGRPFCHPTHSAVFHLSLYSRLGLNATAPWTAGLGLHKRPQWRNIHLPHITVKFHFGIQSVLLAIFDFSDMWVV